MEIVIYVIMYILVGLLVYCIADKPAFLCIFLWPLMFVMYLCANLVIFIVDGFIESYKWSRTLLNNLVEDINDTKINLNLYLLKSTNSIDKINQ